VVPKRELPGCCGWLGAAPPKRLLGPCLRTLAKSWLEEREGGAQGRVNSPACCRTATCSANMLGQTVLFALLVKHGSCPLDCGPMYRKNALEAAAVWRRQMGLGVSKRVGQSAPLPSSSFDLTSGRVGSPPHVNQPFTACFGLRNHVGKTASVRPGPAPGLCRAFPTDVSQVQLTCPHRHHSSSRLDTQGQRDRCQLGAPAQCFLLYRRAMQTL
jgi:hypothetical protein